MLRKCTAKVCAQGKVSFLGSLATGLPSEGRVRAVTSVVQDFWCQPPYLGMSASKVLPPGTLGKYCKFPNDDSSCSYEHTHWPAQSSLPDVQHLPGDHPNTSRKYDVCPGLLVPTSVTLSRHWIWRLTFKLFRSLLAPELTF